MVMLKSIVLLTFLVFISSILCFLSLLFSFFFHLLCWLIGYSLKVSDIFKAYGLHFITVHLQMIFYHFKKYENLICFLNFSPPNLLLLLAYIWVLHMLQAP